MTIWEEYRFKARAIRLLADEQEQRLLAEFRSADERMRLRSINPTLARQVFQGDGR